MVIYTKTALKKIKKDDLIELYLKQQQKLEETREIADEVVEELDASRTEVAKLIQKHLTQGEENRQLKEEIDKLKDQLNFIFPSKEEQNVIAKYQVDRTNRLREIKKLKEENKCLLWKTKELREWVDRNQKEINRLRCVIDEIETDSEEEEECKYDNDDEWRYGYGFTSNDGECRITMAGGGDHWYDYVINKDYCFIHSKEGKQKVRAFILSDPEIRKDYLKVIELNDPEYKLEEGEQDMRDVVEEHYPEVLQYEEEDSQ